MIKDITLGQYFPGVSVVHKLDPRYKIVISVIYIAMLFIGNDYFSLAAGAVFSASAIICSEISLKMIAKSIKPIMPFLCITALMNLFLISGGDTVFEWKFISITVSGIQTSVFMIIRIVLLIAGTSLLTYTTSPIALTDAIERLFGPLKKLKLPVHELAMMMTIALRFIPTLIEETDKIVSAQKARGSDIDGGKLMDKAKAVLPVVIPLFVSAIVRARELATAMECRCYHGGEGRTRMKQLKSTSADYFALAIALLYMSAVILVNIIV